MSQTTADLHNTQVPRADISCPGWRAPAGATDCHFHIFGPRERYPLSPGRAYTPLEASMADYAHITGTLGIERFVIVQASIYGTDNSCALDCVAAWGQERARAVAVIDDGFDAPKLRRMHEAGVRGVRFNAVSGNGTPLEQLHTLARRAAQFDWHVQLYLDGAVLRELGPTLAGLPVPIVIDHMGQIASAKGIAHPEFQALLRLMDSGKSWVKLCGYRSSTAGYPFTDMLDQARALIDAAPERCLWGTDWPHPNFFGAMPDDGKLLDLLGEWAPTDTERQSILVDNPAHLYGFP